MQTRVLQADKGMKERQWLPHGLPAGLSCALGKSVQGSTFGARLSGVRFVETVRSRSRLFPVFLSSEISAVHGAGVVPPGLRRTCERECQDSDRELQAEEMKKGERNEASFLPFVLCQDERALILKYGLVVLADVGVGVQQDEADNQGVNGQRFDECEGKNHGTGDFAAHFRIAGNAVASAAEAKAHADATAKGSDADTESSSHAGAAETGGVKGSGSGESHCGHSHHANEVQSDEKEFAHGMLLARLYMVGPKTSAIPRRVGVGFNVRDLQWHP